MTAAPPLKRFYKEARAAAREGGYGVQLDGRDIRTPAKAALVLPSAGLAEAVAGEWAAQGERIEPATMPLMSLACTAIDQVAPNRGAVIGELMDYAGSDLLCYRADRPEALVARQAEVEDFPLTALDTATRASGSLVIALALHRGQVGAEAAFEAAELDATFQIEHWGEDPEATRRRAAVLADLAAAGRLMDLASD